MDDDPGNYERVRRDFPPAFNWRMSSFVGMGLEVLATMAYGSATRVFFFWVKEQVGRCCSNARCYAVTILFAEAV